MNFTEYGEIIVSGSMKMSAPQGDGGYDEDAVIYWGEYADSLSDSRKALDSQLFIDLKSEGLFAKLDYLRIYAHEFQGVALRNLIAREFDVTYVNSPTFEANGGYTSNGIDEYLETNFNPFAGGVHYVQNSACFGAYFRTLPVEDSQLYGAWNVSPNWRAYFIRGSVGSVDWAINRGGKGGTDSSGALGLYAANRSASTVANLYINGALAGTDSTLASTALQNLPFLGLEINLSGSPSGTPATAQIAVDFAGESLSGAEHSTLFSLIEAYLDQIGAGVA